MQHCGFDIGFHDDSSHPQGINKPRSGPVSHERDAVDIPNRMRERKLRSLDDAEASRALPPRRTEIRVL